MKTRKTIHSMQQNFSWILAGLVVSALLSSAAVSRATEDTWTRKADMPTARDALSASVVNGKIYAIGGSPNGSAVLSTVEEYDPATDTWEKKTDMPAPRRASTSVVNGRIYAIGGRDAASESLSVVEEYNPTTDTWIRKADMPTARQRLSTSTVDGRIYAIGGTGDNGLGLATVEVYDPEEDAWERKSDMPTARGSLATGAVNGKIYAFGGRTVPPQNGGAALSTVEEYDPVTDTWEKKNNMPRVNVHFRASVVDGKIYVISGTNFQTYFSNVEAYDPATDTWEQKANIPTARSRPGVSAVNGKIYVIGGRASGGTFLSTVEEYDTGLTAPSPDFNGDGIVDSADVYLMVEHWHTDNPFYDIAPLPFGDGFVDVQDLIALSEYLTKDVNDPTLVAHWSLDEAEGDIAYDSAGLNDAFVIGGALWQPSGGHVDGALEFDGVDDSVIAGPVLDPTDGPFSVLAWVKGGAPGQAVISQQGGANWLGTDPLEGYLMTELTGPGRSGSPLLSQTAITDGQWHRIGLVWDGLYRTLYVDGIAVAQDTQDGLQSSLNGLYIGTGKAMAPGTFWSGLIDDVRIYTRPVTP